MGSTMRVGNGYDAHRFTDGDGIILGGVRIPLDCSLAAHSDGDVLIHAICDALLGAAALGDIGQHFPDTMDEFAGADSRVLLRRVLELLGAAAWKVTNVDTTVVAEKPKIRPYVEQMRRNIAADLQLDEAQVSVKGTTTEKMGFTGREEGIAAIASVLLSAA